MWLSQVSLIKIKSNVELLSAITKLCRKFKLSALDLAFKRIIFNLERSSEALVWRIFRFLALIVVSSLTSLQSRELSPFLHLMYMGQ